MNGFQFAVDTAKLIESGDYYRAVSDAQAHEGMPNNWLILEGRGGHQFSVVVSSTRVALMGRELPGGPLGEEYAIVCAGDGKKRVQKVIPGGKTQPDFDDDDMHMRVPAGEAEDPWACIAAETSEETAVDLPPESFQMVALRPITERNQDTGEYVPKRNEQGMMIVDALFVATTDERLAFADAKVTALMKMQNETFGREVLRASHLLARTPKDRMRSGEMRMMLPTHALVLAESILIMDELYGKNAPHAMRNVIDDGLRVAKQVVQGSNMSQSIIRVVQECVHMIRRNHVPPEENQDC